MTQQNRPRNQIVNEFEQRESTSNRLFTEIILIG